MNIYSENIYSLLDDIYASSERILNKIHNINEADFTCGQLNEIQDIQDIVVRHLAIVGEAAAKLLKKYPEFCNQHPEIALHQARSMRNFIIHEYNDIDWQQVWDTSTKHLVQLKEKITTIKEEQNATTENPRVKRRLKP
jgi:uncharacterized protein with HEPN domain